MALASGVSERQAHQPGTAIAKHDAAIQKAKIPITIRILSAPPKDAGNHTPDDVNEISAARAMLRLYELALGFSLEFQGFKEELAGLPGAYASPGGVFLMAWGPKVVAENELAQGETERNGAGAVPGEEAGIDATKKIKAEEQSKSEDAFTVNGMKLYGCIGVRPLPAAVVDYLASQQVGKLKLHEEDENGSSTPVPATTQNGSDGGVVGSKRICEVKRLFCVPEARGLGLGAKLVQRAVEEAQALGYEEM